MAEDPKQTQLKNRHLPRIMSMGLAAAALVFCAGLGAIRNAHAQSITQPHPGRLLASNCFQCHGTNGQSIAGMDRIAGKSANSIYEELKEMQQKPANRNIMNVHARGYSDAQLRLLADYLSRQ